MSRWAALLIICIFISHFPFTYAQLPFELYLGDVNCDGVVNTGDVTHILRYCAEDVGIEFYGAIAADVNTDKEINTGDAVILLNDVVGNSALTPVQVVGDLRSPILYTDISYRKFDWSYPQTVALSEYTADAVQTPQSTVTFGKGYSVKLEADTSYVFETSMLDAYSGSVDTVLYLLDNSNNVFMNDDNSGDGKYSRIEFYAWESGTYKLLVTGKTSSQVGSCVLNVNEHIYVTPVPTQTPESTPTATPTSTPTASPTATQQPVDGIAFINQSLPNGGEVVQYKSAYTLNGTITSDTAITKVRAVVYNKDGETELSASKTISSSLELKRYSLTDGGADSIDGMLKFSDLTVGSKKIELYCKTKGNDEQKLFMGEFYVGATDKLLSGNAFSGSSALSDSVRRKILLHLNSLDEDSITTVAIMEAFTDLGVPYGTGSGELDCSSLVQKAYATVGVSLPRTSAEQGRYCYNLNGEISSSGRKAGDLVFFRQTSCGCNRYRDIHHVAIYIGVVDGVKYFLDASSGKDKIVLRKAWGDGDTSGWSIEFYGRPY